MYGIHFRGLWLEFNGNWNRDAQHPSVQRWHTEEQARAWKERHMPGSEAAVEHIQNP